MAAMPNRGATVSVTRTSPCSCYCSNAQSGTSAVFSAQIGKKFQGPALLTCCAKKNRTGRKKMEDMSALYSGSFGDKRRGKVLKALSKDLSAMSDTLHQHHFCAGEIDKSVVDQVRRQILEGAVDVLKTQLEQRQEGSTESAGSN
ncbi:hypothetical protein SUGI_0123330 [Cryptomeria japonica]|uniref:uncharacterized protein LOC131065913 n=1 Tax=Cryptomeria japonica TaxID=3369 RepID=UPI002408CFC9|nr:uncharacterized protein LOC131065913 [Cryptomeria japonica]GLJ10171.1 hypothetical protein SUGI_0123330 [Cryptomeria japonica]